MQPSLRLPKWIPWTLLLVSVLGFSDAAYLTAKHYQGEAPTCILFSGCETVSTSPYAVIGPGPVALIGALFYLAIFVLTLLYIERRKEKALQILAILSIPAFVFTLWLLYLQLFVIHALCAYCVFSAFSSTAIFVLSQLAWRSVKRTQPSTLPSST